jgi:hypothetical protein
MDNFNDIVNLLQRSFPGAFTCTNGKSGHANGLRIRCSGHAGHAFVYERQNDRAWLLALFDADDDKNPEVWSAGDANEIVNRIRPWAFPQPRQSPRPIDKVSERKRLEKIVKGLLARPKDATCRVVDAHPEVSQLLTANGLHCFQKDVKAVNARQVITHFPWDASGRLALNTAVLLSIYESTKAPGKGRDLCLAALGPERRSDIQEVRIKLIDLILVNQTHRWDRCLWYWTSEIRPDFELLGTDSFSTREDGCLAIQSLDLLDAGRIDEALMLYGVTLSSDVRRLLGGERIKPPACCAHPDKEWTKLLIGTLRQAAPWLLSKAVADEAERLRQWASEKSNRRKRSPSLKLFIFPGQHHARKASLMLAGDINGRNPRFVIEATASNARLHDTAWKLPFAVQCLRNGVQFPQIG